MDENDRRLVYAARWFFKLLMDGLVRKHEGEIVMGRGISRKDLYAHVLGFRFDKTRAREVLTLLTFVYPDVQFSNQGMWIPDKYRGERGSDAFPSASDDRASSSASPAGDA